jgi:hypothetical protein
VVVQAKEKPLIERLFCFEASGAIRQHPALSARNVATPSLISGKS